MGKNPTSLPEDRSEWPSGGKSTKAGEPDPEEAAGEDDGHLASPQQGARTYALQSISPSVPNPSASGPRMHDYAICAGRAGRRLCRSLRGYWV